MKSKIFTSKNFLISLLLTLFLTTGAFSQCPSGLDAYLRFETTEDGSYPDEVSNHTGVVANGSLTSVVGLASVGKAVSFNGSSDELNIINSSDFDTWTSSSNFSIELWVKFTELNGTQVFIGRDASSGYMQWWIGATSAGKVTWYITDSNNNNAQLTSASAINDGVWHHIVAVKEGSSLNLYVDGVAASGTKTFTGNFSASGNSVTVGYLSVNSSSEYHYNGAIDEVALYSDALSNSSIAEHLLNNGSYGIGYCDDEGPTILTTPSESATIGKQYTYDVNASGKPTPSYSLLTFPSGMGIDDETGVISWTPTESSGSTTVVVEASNSVDTVTQTFSIYLAAEPDYPTGLEAIWKFDESSFEYEYINQHQLVGSASQTNGLIDGAAYFSGTSSSMFELEDSYEPSSIFFDFPSYNYSVSFWMSSSVSGEDAKVAVGRDVPANSTNWWIGFNSNNGQAVWYARDYLATNNDTVYISGGLVNDGDWHLITAVRDEDADKDYLYVDGVEVGQASSNHVGFGGNSPLTVGWYDVSPYYYFEGALDELSFFSTALSQATIEAMYDEGIAGNSLVQENHYPNFSSTIDTVATEEILYSKTIYFEDIDGDDVTPAISGNPEWLVFNFTTGNDYFTLTGTPTNEQVGKYEITFTLTDGSLTSTQVITFYAVNVNDDPVITSTPTLTVNEDELYEYVFEVEDVDIDDILTLTALKKPDWLTFTQGTDTTATLTGTPLNDDSGVNDTIILNVNDGTVDVEQEFILTVVAVNDKPEISAQKAVSIAEDNSYTITFDDLTVSDVDNNVPEDLSIEILEGTNYTFENTVITPAEDYNGALLVNLVVMDNDSTSDEYVFTITVTPVNDAPELVSEIDTVAMENVPYENVFEFFDADDDEITVEVVTKPDWITFESNTLSCTPTSENIGEHAIAIRLDDGNEQGITYISFTLTVINTNDAPVFESTPVEVADDYEEYEYTVVVSDKDGDDVTVTATTKPDWLTFTDNVLSGTPDWEDANQTFDVTLTATDGITEVKQIFQITVGNDNDPPYFTTEPVDTAYVGVPYTYLFKADDIDEDEADNLTFSYSELPDWLTFNDAGVISGTPTTEGSYPVILSVTDPSGDQTRQPFTIVVTIKTGIQQNLIESLSIFPNPAQSEITLNLADIKNPSKVEILDVTGKVKITEYLINYDDKLKLDVSGLVNGLYFVRIQDEEMTTYLSKLIINK